MIEEDLLNELKASFLARELTLIKESGELGDFIEFAKEQAKKDGMDTKGLMDFLDNLTELTEDEEKSDINWFKVQSALNDVLPFKCRIFKGDNTLIIENEMLTREQCSKYLVDEKPPLHLATLNDALKPLGLCLVFIESLNNPFDLDGFQNFLRFEVKKL